MLGDQRVKGLAPDGQAEAKLSWLLRWVDLRLVLSIDIEVLGRQPWGPSCQDPVEHTNRSQTTDKAVPAEEVRRQCG